MGEEAEESPPCPYFNRGHCRDISNGNCKLSHNAQTCWEEKCGKSPTCDMRHPPSCNLFFRSSRGCHRKVCSHRHLPPQEAPTKPAHTVLIAAGDDRRFDELYKIIAAQQTQMSELHARLAAQEILTQSLLNSISKLGCKQGNTEKSFKELLEHQDIKRVGEIGCLDIQVERNKKTMEELKTDVNATMQKEIDKKLEVWSDRIEENIQDYIHGQVSSGQDAYMSHLTAVDTRLKEQDHLLRSDLTNMDVKLTKLQTTVMEGNVPSTLTAEPRPPAPLTLIAEQVLAAKIAEISPAQPTYPPITSASADTDQTRMQQNTPHIQCCWSCWQEEQRPEFNMIPMEFRNHPSECPVARPAARPSPIGPSIFIMGREHLLSDLPSSLCVCDQF